MSIGENQIDIGSCIPDDIELWPQILLDVVLPERVRVNNMYAVIRRVVGNDQGGRSSQTVVRKKNTDSPPAHHLNVAEKLPEDHVVGADAANEGPVHEVVAQRVANYFGDGVLVLRL